MNILLFLLVGLAVGAFAARKTTVPLRPALAATALGAILGGFTFGSLGSVFLGPFSSIFTAAAGASLMFLLVRPFYRGTEPSL